jgi:hypothetical protein
MGEGRDKGVNSHLFAANPRQIIPTAVAPERRFGASRRRKAMRWRFPKMELRFHSAKPVCQFPPVKQHKKLYFWRLKRFNFLSDSESLSQPNKTLPCYGVFLTAQN